MSSSSDNQKINIDALLDIAEQDDEEKEYEIRDEMQLFIDKHNIKDGNTWVWNWQARYVYNENATKKLTQKEFDKEFMRYFKRKTVRGPDRTYGHYIYSLSVSLEVPFYVKYRHRRAKKTTKKISK